MELEQLKEIISTVMNVDKNSITEKTTFVEDLNCDSIEIFQIVMGIEETFGLQIPIDEIKTISTVGDAVKKIKESK